MQAADGSNGSQRTGGQRLSAGSLVVNAPSTADLVHERLRTMILQGDFAPAEQLNEARLSAAFGISRGPLREAIQRLVAEGLLTSARNRGVFVLDLDAAAIRDIYFMRRVLETEVFLRAQRQDHGLADRLRPWIAEMSKAVAAADWHAVATADMAFHKTAVDSVGSARMSGVFETLMAQSTICVRNLRTAYPQPESLVDEHVALVETMLSDDRETMVDEVAEHMSSAADRLTEQLALARS